MAAIALTINTPSVDATADTTRRRYTMPTTGAPYWVRIYSASDCYLELVDAADGSARGSAYETIPAGIPASRVIRRGEFCVSGSAAQTIEVTVTTRTGT